MHTAYAVVWGYTWEQGYFFQGNKGQTLRGTWEQRKTFFNCVCVGGGGGKIGGGRAGGGGDQFISFL